MICAHNIKYFILILLSLALSGVASAQLVFLVDNVPTGQTYVGGIDQGETAISAASDYAVSSISRGPGVATVGFSHDSSHSDPTGGASRAFETEITQNSGHISYIHDFESFLTGLSLSSIDSEMEGDYSDNGNVGEVDIFGDGWVASLAISHNWGPLTATVVGGSGNLDLDSIRKNNIDESTSNFETDLTFFTVDLNFTQLSTDYYTIAPFMQVNYLDVSMDEFTENSGADAGTFNKTERDWITTEFGLRSSMKLTDALSARFTLSWEHDLTNDMTEISGESVAPFNDAGSLEVPIVGENRIKTFLGIDYYINEQWVITAEVDASASKDNGAFGAAILIGRSF